MDFNLYTWVIIPILIFISRVMDVSLGTIRVIFISRGMKYTSALIGFFEILIWIVAMGQILKNLSNPLCYFGYAGGFAMGNYVGVYIGEKLSLGTAIVRVILREDSTKLIRAARKMNLGVTTVEGHGRHGPVDIIFTVMPKRMVKRFIKIVDRYNPRAFYSIEEVGYVQKGVFPAKRKITPQEMVTSFKAYRTRK